ncbi:MAG: hypothetical protein LBU35_01055, partial [Holosporales bacterium]|nr:hypothetical protein [Holosporales bacterium]
MFQFFVGIEAMGLISAIFVSLEKNAVENSIRTLVFNKFASLMFLMGIFLIAININSFDFSVIKQYCESGRSSVLFLPTCLILISVLCKGAQFPFSYWLLDAVKANIFASIIIHSATIIAVGILFIAKCYSLFESFSILKEAM